MGLETAAGIWELVESWPLQTDKIRQGAGHLRNIKQAIKTTFPGINAPVTVGDHALNSLPADFQLVLAQIIANLVPVGAVIAWAGTVASIPAGWALCNGQTVAGYGVTPNLTDRFLVGAGNGYNPGDTGGAVTKTTTSDGAHTPVIQAHALTTAELPSHSHAGATFAGSNADNGDPGQLIVTSSFEANGTMSSPSLTTGTAGSNAGHTHGANVVPDHLHAITDIRPPYYALAYIVKTVGYVAP